jgi:ribosomal protein L11 methyltransferase
VTARWLAVRVRPGSQREAAIASLFGLGAVALEELGDALITQLPMEVGRDRILAALCVDAPAAAAEVAEAEVIDWSSRWRESIRAHDLGALTIAPPWLAGGMDPARTVVIEPEMAFGTGEHATTRGVVRLLQSVVRSGSRVADLGTGSAVLAIAAAKLGAARVVAIEIDPDAIPNAESNVARNGVDATVTVIEGDASALLPLVAPVDVITANIISSVLLRLLPGIESALAADGCAIISGILATEREDMVAALDASGWTIAAEDSEDVWWSASIART